MSHFTLTIGPLGPLLTAFVGVSQSRHEQIQKAGLPTPEPIRIQGLIDTGASSTVVDQAVLTQLAISPTGRTHVHTPSTDASTPHEMFQYDVGIMIPGSDQSRSFLVPVLPVIASNLAHQGFHALIGRDVLAFCVLNYVGAGQSGHFTLAF